MSLGEVVYPEKFNSKYIVTHPACESDLKGILEKSGLNARFISIFKNRLRFLEDRKEQCILRDGWFENLKRADEINVIRFDKTIDKNIRILFAFIKCNGAQYAILLYAFEEKGGKPKSKNSYDNAIAIAQKRLKEVMGDDRC